MRFNYCLLTGCEGGGASGPGVRVVFVCARPVITFSTWFLSFKKKPTKQQTTKKNNNNQKPVKEELGGSFKTLRDAIRRRARSGECLTNSLHAKEQRVQLETKYNSSDQIASRRYPNKTLLLRWPFTRSPLFLRNFLYKANTKKLLPVRSGPVREEAADCSHTSRKH